MKEDDQRVNVEGDNNKLTIVEQHLANQQQIELGLENLLVIAVFFIVYFVGSKIYKYYQKKVAGNKRKRLDKLRRELSRTTSAV